MEDFSRNYFVISLAWAVREFMRRLEFQHGCRLSAASLRFQHCDGVNGTMVSAPTTGFVQ
jgi:hypothetical protein